MRLCWERNPSDRPYFAIIQDQLEALEDSKLVSLLACASHVKMVEH